MKKLYIILAFIGITGLVKAQGDQPSEKKQADIEALKVAFISKELDLTPDEAQKFWPQYNQYSKELKAIKLSNPDDVLDGEEKVLNLRKSYKEQFTKILGPQRVNNMYNAEGRFHQLLFKAMRKQNQLQNRPIRPLQRRNF
jgi:hypothetical protein